MSESTHTEVWHVQLPSGDVRVMTLDELDEAFQEGHITEDTFVLAHGSTTWAKLADVAGLEGEEASTDVAPAPAPVAMAPAPVAVAPVPIAVEPAVVATRAPAFVEPAPMSAPQSFAPLNSMRPVVSELGDLDVDPVAFRSSKKRAVTFVVAGLMVLGGAAFAFTKFGMPSAEGAAPPAAAPVAAAAAPAIPVNVTSSIAADVHAALKPSDTPAADNASGSRLTDAQRRALMDQDKARELKRKARTPASSPHHSPKRPTGPAPFHNGGDKYDPLNSSL